MELVEKCISRGIFVHPEVKQKLEEQEAPDKIIDKILDEHDFENPVLLPSHIEKYIENNPPQKTKKKEIEVEDIQEKQRKTEDEEKQPRKPSGNREKPNVKKQQPEKQEHEVPNEKEGDKAIEENGVSIKKDITGKSECEGDLKNFINYFSDRYERIKNEITKRNGMRNVRPIESIESGRDDISIVGIVKEVRDTKNGHKLIKLEDHTGEVPALALKNRENVYDDSEEVLLDEVIGIKGSKSSNGSDLLIIDDFVWPDLPISRGEPKQKGDGYIAFISDVHFGSTTFLDEAWDRFIAWLNGEVGGPQQKETVRKLKYICIAGDLVEGIGIYPGQKEELKTTSIKEQYKEAARQLNRIPNHIEIILSPGNHDAVRQAEPQPAFNEEIQSYFNKNNITFIGNPSTIKIDNTDITVYHGRSLDDLIEKLPKRTYEKPAEVMKEYIRRRHLAPIYGAKTPLAPENEDYLIVDKPDIIHCGHVHKFGVDKYKGVNLFNTGTWQKQTKFQKKKGIKPDPGRVVLYNLEDHEPKIVKFCN